MRLGTIFLVAAGLLCASSAAAGVTAKPHGEGVFVTQSFTQLPVHVGGRIEPDLILVASSDRTPGGRQVTQASRAKSNYNIYPHQWPGVYFEAAFAGNAVYLKFDDSLNIYNLYIDDDAAVRIALPGDTEYRIDGLSPGPHRARLEKLSESQSNSASFAGFYVDQNDKARPAPPPRTRQIEIIGDSYAAGYGDTSAKHECTQDEIRDATDSQQAFGPLLGRTYTADYQINAVSGIGMVRNYDDGKGGLMPALYPYDLFKTSPLYSDPAWNPQVVIIALGDNDFATPVKPGGKWADSSALGDDFVSAYIRFVEAARQSHPRATFILMDYGEPPLITALARIADALKADGETRVRLWSAGTAFEQTGCDWHLSLNDHKRISAGLTAYIDSLPGFWSTPQHGQ